jgi:hypothetical protein
MFCEQSGSVLKKVINCPMYGDFWTTLYYTGIRLFNNLPPTIKILNCDVKVFELALEDYFLTNSF